jgi:glycosyltransferase involved in cell wall biosynthesis
MTRSDDEKLCDETSVDNLMPDKTKLAIIIPCYNYASFVERAIQSVVGQHRTDCELVVVDDGSTDDSWDVISRSGATAFRLENGGPRLACLFALDKTTAPFVLFLDADDELKPGALGKIIDHLDSDVAKLQFPLTRIDADGNVISAALPGLDTFRDRQGLARQVLRSGVYKSPPTSGNVFRRDLCELLREADYDKFVDGVTLFAAPFYGDVVSISEEIGCYRIHGRNDSGLGRSPDAASIERDIARYLARMEHLRTIIRRREPNQELVDPRDTFYYREMEFCLDIVSGRRPRLTALLGLVPKLLGEPFSVKNKVAMTTFDTLAAVLPNDRAKALLAYRFKTGPRTAAGFAKEIIGWRARN